MTSQYKSIFYISTSIIATMTYIILWSNSVYWGHFPGRKQDLGRLAHRKHLTSKWSNEPGVRPLRHWSWAAAQDVRLSPPYLLHSSHGQALLIYSPTCTLSFYNIILCLLPGKIFMLTLIRIQVILSSSFSAACHQLKGLSSIVNTAYYESSMISRLSISFSLVLFHW